MNRSPNRRICFLHYALFLPISLGVSGCVDLSGGRASIKKPIPQNAPFVYEKHQINKVKYSGEVHTMLGGLGVFSTGMRALSNSVEEEYHLPAPSDMWYNAGHVTQKIVTYYREHKKHRPIILVGHSLGANEQIKVARNLNKLGISVDLLITVDAVSVWVVPPNVKHVMNFYKRSYVPMFSGLKLRAVAPQKTRVDNINVATLQGVSVNHFTIDKDPIVQAMMMEEIKKVTANAKG